MRQAPEVIDSRAEAGTSSIFTPGGFFLGETNAGRKTKAAIKVADRLCGGLKPQRLLVIGCGAGDDAAELARYFGHHVHAIDVENYFNARNSEAVTFSEMDARDLKFQSGAFDFIYSFHALEHIPEPERAMREVRRVLDEGGAYCIGTPNRLRAVGYVGVPDYPLRNKVRSNLRDWGQRLRGRFRNELGAHAGFSSAELMALCGVIGGARDMTEEYYRELYAGRPKAVSLITSLGIGRWAWPSVYVLGTKGAAS